MLAAYTVPRTLRAVTVSEVQRSNTAAAAGRYLSTRFKQIPKEAVQRGSANGIGRYLCHLPFNQVGHPRLAVTVQASCAKGSWGKAKEPPGMPRRYCEREASFGPGRDNLPPETAPPCVQSTSLLARRGKRPTPLCTSYAYAYRLRLIQR